MVKKQIAVCSGDIFGVPLGDDTYVLGQVIEVESCPMNSYLCGFYDFRHSDLDKLWRDGISLASQAPITIQFVTKELFKSGVWKILANASPANACEFEELAALREKKFIGARILGAGIIRKFLMACHGLYPWNGPAEADYFDRLLLNRPRPAAAIFAENRGQTGI